MTDFLMLIAIGLMVAALGAWLMSASMDDAEKARRVPRTTQRWLMAMAVAGCVVGFGGYWVEWMLWAGLILMDAPLLVFSILVMKKKATDIEQPPP